MPATLLEESTDSLLVEDCVSGLRHLATESVHAIVTDIPYGISAEEWDVLHNNTNSALRGTSPAQARAGSVFKTRGKPINGWSAADRAIAAEYQAWCGSWANEWFRLLKPGASAIVFAGR
jgi:site-specific DNA-methyltransferase (adenine-specific)